jgi:hypothetical protein
MNNGNMKLSKKRICGIIFLLFLVFILYDRFIFYNKKYLKFEDYIFSELFNNEEILENNFYSFNSLKYKARIIYSGLGTHFNIYDNQNKDKLLFSLKYWTIIEPIEFVKINEEIMVKIKTKDNRIGWINGNFIELYYYRIDLRNKTI